MTRQHRVADAIRDAQKCDDYQPEDGEPCDGLMGCEDCLWYAAEAAIEACEEAE